MNTTEKWKPIEGYEGLYEVSSTGRVKSLKKGIMKPSTSNKGYLLVCVSKKGISRTFSVHRLVAKAFCPNTENKAEVDHINGVRTDNRSENLRWVSSSENHLNPITRENSSRVRKGHKLSEETRRKLSEANRGVNHPNFGKHRSEETKKKLSEFRKGKKMSEETKKKLSQVNMNSKACSKPVVQLSKNGEEINRFPSVNEAGRILKINSNCISACCRGRLKTSGGFVWRYIEEGMVLTEDDKKKISESCKGIHFSEEHRKHLCKPIIQFSLGGDFIQQWDSLTDAADVLGLSSSAISMCLSGKTKTSGGFVWRFVKEEKVA